MSYSYRHASLSFTCPNCDANLRSDLNVSNCRKAGENTITCDKCGSHIEIAIDINADPKDEDS